ncbi:MAG: hypothetical protein ABIS35_12210 [Terracoccus sp.]
MHDRLYLVPLAVISALVVCVFWVLRDARANAAIGHPVTVYIGDFRIDRPEVWASACLVMWVVFFPLYLKARSES